MAPHMLRAGSTIVNSNSFKSTDVLKEGECQGHIAEGGVGGGGRGNGLA